MMQIEVSIVGGSLSGAGQWPVRAKCVQRFTSLLTPLVRVYLCLRHQRHQHGLAPLTFKVHLISGIDVDSMVSD
jgi:hypothetical protein